MVGLKLDPTQTGRDAEKLYTDLHKRIIGQDEAIAQIVNVYQMHLVGMNSPSRPIGNLLFLGPTGSGKTRLAEATAESLVGDARVLIKIDCAEFQHSHEIAKLIGSPPGYLGHRETHPLLTQEALNQWHTDKLKLSILLFDEIEKASDSLWQLLLGILDKATLTLGDNRRVDLSQCIIIMTSNLGAGEMTSLVDGGLGFAPKVQVVDQGLEIELGMVQQRALTASAANQFVFSCTEKVKSYLLHEGTDPRYGARHLKRAIERHLVFPMANLVATNQIRLGDFIRIDLNAEGSLTFVKEAEGAMVPLLMERYGAAAGTSSLAARAVKPIAKPKEFTATPGNETK